MITLSIILAILYGYSILRIKKDSDSSWKEFNPFNSNIYVYFLFIIGTLFFSFWIVFGLIFLISTGIIP
jgi:hypothetical protein